MADNDSNQPSGVPPKPADAPKVQPKKETVRISLPPKPTATSTIKLPSLPAGGKPPGGAPAAKPPGGATPGAPKPPGAAGAPPPPKPPAAAAPGTRVARPPGAATPAAGAKPAAPAKPAARGRAAAGRAQSSPVDTGLTIAAAVLGIGAVVSVLLLLGMK